jgi:hypothetical protein
MLSSSSMFNPYLTIVLKISKELVMFNINKFFNSFELNIRALQESERVTKSTLGFLSRDVLEALHTEESKTFGDIQYVNRLLAVLSPMNKKTFIKFIQELGGFLFNEKDGVFTKKDKVLYSEKRTIAMALLADANWNIWVYSQDWSPEGKPYTLDKISESVKTIFKKAEKNGLKRADVIKAILAGGIEAEEMLALMDAVAE